MIHWSDLLTLTLAYILALPLAIEREREEQSAGLRTFPLMALASCAVMLISIREMDVAGQGRLAGPPERHWGDLRWRYHPRPGTRSRHRHCCRNPGNCGSRHRRRLSHV
jgi:hypothetical protein